ncbi:hypothetical protein PAUR_a2674 [Pseudoalteromonas aurantia 208]|uniref:Orphan protein n=1 Tax=Pseudoalteromonas aurantia 208 TaxID=1314867 RepID=A0ABR9ED78_9GAMM|nr:hypothetical protein [Pseudoalteromonas aurantia 208]
MNEPFVTIRRFFCAKKIPLFVEIVSKLSSKGFSATFRAYSMQNSTEKLILAFF